jgi:hypothetical protein
MDWSSGVFKIPVGHEFITYYAKSSLVCISGKLYVPDQFDFIDSAAFIHRAMLDYHFEKKKISLAFMKYCTHEACKNMRVVVLDDVHGNEIGVFKQNHLVDYHNIRTSITTHRFARFILEQDQITIRIIRIQRWLKEQLFKKRLHLLAIFAANKNMMNADIILLISSHL